MDIHRSAGFRRLKRAVPFKGPVGSSVLAIKNYTAHAAFDRHGAAIGFKGDISRQIEIDHDLTEWYIGDWVVTRIRSATGKSSHCGKQGKAVYDSYMHDSDTGYNGGEVILFLRSQTETGAGTERHFPKTGADH